MNYCFQRRDKYLRIFTTKDLIKQMNYKTIDYDDVKFIINSIDLETDFSELRDPVAFLNSIKKPEILIEEARHKRKKFNRYLKKVTIGNKSEKREKSIG